MLSRMNVSKLVPVLMVALVLCLQTGCGEQQQIAVEHHLLQSKSYQQQGQYRAAMIEARNALMQDPQNLKAQRRLSAIYNELGYSRSTLKLITQSDHLDDAQLILAKAQAYNHLHKYRSSLKLLSRYNASDFGEFKGRYLLLYGEALASNQQEEHSRSALEEASRMEGGEEAAIFLAQLDMATGKSAVAESRLKTLLADNPEHTTALLTYGQLMQDRDDAAGAEEMLTRALASLPTTDLMTPLRIITLQKLSALLTQQGRSEEAYLYSRILADAMPEYMESRNQLTEASEFLANGDLNSAEQVLTRLLEKGNRKAGAMLGVVQYMRGDFRAASEYLDEYLDPETANTQALEIITDAKLRLNDLEKVVEILQPIVNSDNTSPSLKGLYGLALLARNDSSGMSYIDEALEADPSNSRIRLILIARAVQSGDREEALNQARLAYQFNPADRRVQGALLSQLIANEQVLEARQIISDMLRQNKDDARTHSIAGLAYLRLGDLEKARSELERSAELDDEQLATWLALAQIAMLENEYETARLYYQYAMNINPLSPVAYKGLFGTFEASGETSQGLEQLSTLGGENQTNPVPLGVLAEYHLLKGNLDDSSAFLQQALTRGPHNPYVRQLSIKYHFEGARQALRNRDLEKARASIVAGLAQAPDSVPLLTLLARIDMLSGRPEDARQSIARIKQYSVYQGLILEGDLAALQKNSKQASQFYQQAWVARPTSDLGERLYKALLLSSQTEARQFLGRWLQAMPQDSKALFLAASHAHAAGKHAQASKLYQQLLEINPNHTLALNNLALLYLDRGDGRALATAAKAYDLAPGNVAVLDTYGWILLQHGSREQAIELLSKALQLAPENTEIQQHLEQAKNP